MSQRVRQRVHSSTQSVSQPPEDPCRVFSDLPGASYRSMPLNMTGAEIIELRQHVRWTQEDLAKQIGYSRGNVSRWERGEQLVPSDACMAILREVTKARMTAEEARLARYQMLKWLRAMQEATCTALSRVGIG